VERLPGDRIAASVLHAQAAKEASAIVLLLGGADGARDPDAGSADPLLGSSLPAPALAVVAEDEAAAREALAERIRRRVPDLTPAKLADALRFFPEEALETVTARVVPLGPTGEELAPLEVPFAVVVTTMPRPPHRATVPRLGIVLALEEPGHAAASARAEITALLGRTREMRAFERLRDLAPALEARLETLLVEAPAMTALDALELTRAEAGGAGAKRAKADREVLASVSTDLVHEGRRGALAVAHEHEEAVAAVLAFLSGTGDRAVALVGPSGAGKTAAVHEAARRLAASGDAGAARLREVTGARIIAGMSGLGEWQERCRAIVDACARERTALFVGDPHELIDAGPSNLSSTTIAQFLKRPVLEGKLRLLAECTPEGWEALERRDRGFASLFRPVRVPEADRPRSLAVLERVADELHASGRARVGADALAAAHDLLARFAPYDAFPGKAVRLLRRIARELPADPGRRFGRGDMVRAFARRTGLPEALLSDEVPLDPDVVRARLRRRVKGQEAAIEAAAALTARVKAGVTDPRRPLGSFIFLGPTGTGKTETAKALAELIFGDERRLVRIDMSEYQDGRAAARLLSGPSGRGEGELVRRVRAEPLTVLLLDEVEKADAGVFDLLLQVMGEARLTDARGRTTDFRSAIVILTSNLGADAPEGALGFGEAEDGAATEAHAGRFLAAAEAFFRPELVARLDAIIPFRALPRATIEGIAGRLVESALARDGLARRGTRAHVSRAVIDLCAREGFHPRYGARPLKRAVERLVAAPIAALLSAVTPPPRAISVDLDDSGAPLAKVEVGAERKGGPLLSTATGEAGDAAQRARVGAEELMRAVADERRRALDLSRDDAVLEARDEAETLAGERRRAAGAGRRAEGSAAGARFDASAEGARLRRLERVLGVLAQAQRAVVELEDVAMLAFGEGDVEALAALAPEVPRRAREIDAAAFLVRALRFAPQDAALLLIAPLDRAGGGGSARSLVPELARLYAAHARRHGLEVYAHEEARAERRPRDAVQWTDAPRGGPRGGQGGVGWLATETPPASPGGGAVALLVSGPDAVARFAAEAGRHRSSPARPGEPERVALVRVLPLANQTALEAGLAALRTIKLPEEAAAPGFPAGVPEVVRAYDERADPPVARDPRTHHAAPLAGIEALAGEALDAFTSAALAGAPGAGIAAEANAAARRIPRGPSGANSQEGRS